MPGTARADVVSPTTTWAEIYDPYTSAPACPDDPGGSTAVNTPLELWHCHGYDSQGTPQRWYFSHGDPVFQLELFHTGYCRALPDLSGGNAEPLMLEPCGPGNLKAYWMLG